MRRDGWKASYPVVKRIMAEEGLKSSHTKRSPFEYYVLVFDYLYYNILEGSLLFLPFFTGWDFKLFSCSQPF